MTPELHKKPGICYAFSLDGLELPVIDISHPAFRVEISDGELIFRSKRFAQEQASKGALSRWLQHHILPFFLKRSLIGRGLLKMAGGYLDGMTTYLMKLGPDNLGQGYAKPMDFKLAKGMEQAGMIMRLRLQDMAETLSKGLAPLLPAGPSRPLHLINLAGGPSMDSLNALLLLQRVQPSRISTRPTQIHVLDLEEAGPQFAGAALAALQAEGSPLHGLTISLKAIHYDWNDTRILESLLKTLPPDALVAFSSEGGLCDYGSDDQVLAHFRVLKSHSPADTFLAVSFSKPSGDTQQIRRFQLTTLKLRSLEDMQPLAAAAGWEIQASSSRPMSVVYGLKRST